MDAGTPATDAIDFGADEPVYQQLARILRRQILSAQLPAGARLPERTLARRYEVTRTTVRSTLALLGRQGLIRRAPRRGMVVADVDGGRHFSTMPSILVREGLLEPSGIANSSDWYNRIYKGIQAMAHEMGYELRRETVADPIRVPLREYVAPPPAQTGGVILYGTYDEQYMGMFRSEGVPLVVVDYWTHDVTTDCVAVDVEAEAFTLADYLARNGHTSLGFIATGRMSQLREFHEYDPDIQRMLDSLRLAARRRRIELRDEWVLLVPTLGHLRHAVKGYLTTQPRPTALLCFEAGAAEAVLQAGKELDLRCPDAFSLVTRGIAAIGGRQVTSFINSPEMMGRMAVRLLSERMQGLRSQAAKLVLSSQLVLGRTAGEARQ